MGSAVAWLTLAASALLLLIACGSRTAPVQRRIGNVGRIDFHPPRHGSEGIVVGATQGFSEPAAVQYAAGISEKTGAGLAVAYGFRTKRVPVA